MTPRHKQFAFKCFSPPLPLLFSFFLMLLFSFSLRPVTIRFVMNKNVREIPKTLVPNWKSSINIEIHVQKSGWKSSLHSLLFPLSSFFCSFPYTLYPSIHKGYENVLMGRRENFISSAASWSLEYGCFWIFLGYIDEQAFNNWISFIINKFNIKWSLLSYFCWIKL